MSIGIFQELRVIRKFNWRVFLLQCQTIALVALVPVVFSHKQAIQGRGGSGSILIQSDRPSVEGRTINIRVLDGHNDHPVHGEQLNVWFLKESLKIVPWNYPRRTPEVLPLPTTGKNGTVMLQVPDGAASLEIESNLYIDCRPYHKSSPGRPAYSLSKILNEGLVLENTCGKASVQPRAGEVTFYVRPWHWWERFLHPG